MNRIGQKLIAQWVAYGPRFMPFADVATPDLPLGRLIRLSLFQVSVGMALVLLAGTLNRVMIVELNVPSTIVGVMIALPLVFAPFRALIGHRSDAHRCELGWRRVPFIWKGTLLQFGGFAMMPFAILVLAGDGESHSAPAWLGQLSAAIAFLLVGAGVHTVQTVGLALATDLTEPKSHPRVVGLMYVMLLLGMMLSALAFGAALADFSPGRLVQVVQGAAVLTVALNLIAIWKQETRRPPRGRTAAAAEASFSESWHRLSHAQGAIRQLVVVGVGTLAFTMSDILLEPFGGQVLSLSVSATTRLTALLAFGGLLGFWYASHVLARGREVHSLSRLGAAIGLPAFALVSLAALGTKSELFLIGTFLIGFGGALFGHATLTATMNQAPKAQTGMALGAWGAVQATAAGLAMILSGIIRDLVAFAVPASAQIPGVPAEANGYLAVYLLEIALLLAVIAAISPLIRASLARKEAPAIGASPAQPLNNSAGEAHARLINH